MIWKSRIVGHDRVDPASLVANPLNHRTHPQAQRDAMAASISEIGFVRSVTVNKRTGNLIDGHERVWQALHSEQPLIDVEYVDLSEDEERKALAVMDRIGEMAEVDEEQLALLIEDLDFAEDDLSGLIEEMALEAGLDWGDPPPEDPGAEVDRAEELRVEWGTERGQLWEVVGPSGLGHRLLCGDSNQGDVARVMGGETCESVVTDPPYGIDFDTDYRRMTTGFDVDRTNHPRVHGDEQPFNPAPWLEYKHVALFGANCFCSHLPLGTWLMWDKRFANGEAILSDGELAWVKGGYGVYIRAVTSQGFIRPERIQHPTQKPVAVMAWLIEKSKATDPILDPFLGSGTTMVAAEQLNRRCYGIEISPAYVAVALQRMKDMGCECKLEASP